MPQEPEIDLEDLQEQLAKLLKPRLTKPIVEHADDELIRKVNSFVALPVDFKPGDVVRWKSGLKNKRFPAEGQLAIVINQLSAPFITDKDAGTPYFQEPLDLVLAVLDKEGELVVFYYDRRRFERVRTNGANFSEDTIKRLSESVKSDTEIPVSS